MVIFYFTHKPQFYIICSLTFWSGWAINLIFPQNLIESPMDFVGRTSWQITIYISLPIKYFRKEIPTLRILKSSNITSLVAWNCDVRSIEKIIRLVKKPRSSFLRKCSLKGVLSTKKYSCWNDVGLSNVQCSTMQTSDPILTKFGSKNFAKS